MKNNTRLKPANARIVQISAALIGVTALFALLHYSSLFANFAVIADHNNYSFVGFLAVLDYLVSLLGPALVLYLAFRRPNGRTNLLLILATFIVGAILIPLIQVSYSTSLVNETYDVKALYIQRLQSFSSIVTPEIQAILRFSSVFLWLAAILLATIALFVKPKKAPIQETES